MEKKLPKNWVETSIGELFTLRQGIQVSKPDQRLEFKEGMIQFLRIVDFTKTNEPPRYVNDPGETYHMQEDDIALVRYGTVGFVCYGKSGVIANNLFRVIPNMDLNKKYVTYYLKSSGFQNSLVSKGATMQALSFKTVNPILFPLPTLAEQQRIVAKLDELFGHLATLKTRLNNIPQILKNFRQAVLTQAVTGKLTEEWRVGKELAKWNEDILANLLADSPKNGAYYHQSLYGSGTRIIRIDSFDNGKLRSWDVVKYVQIPKSDIKTYGLALNDILINRVNSIQYLGKCLLIESLPEACIFESNMMLIKCDAEKITPKYLKTYLTSINGLKELRKNAKHAVHQASINQGDVKNVLVNFPSLEEQTEVVKRVEHLFTKADAIEAQYLTLKTKIDSLPQAILAKAFKGELVEQLETDGDAKELLEEIKKLKVKVEGNSKTTKKKMKKIKI